MLFSCEFVVSESNLHASAGEHRGIVRKEMFPLLHTRMMFTCLDLGLIIVLWSVQHSAIQQTSLQFKDGKTKTKLS